MGESGAKRLWWLVITAVVSGAVGMQFDIVKSKFDIGKTTVPNVVGLDLREATTSLAHAGFETDYPTAVPGGVKDAVVDQMPRPPAHLGKGGAVHLTVQSGELVSTKPGPKRITVQIGNPIRVTLRNDLHIESNAPPSSLEGVLVNPISAGKDVIAYKGSPVLLALSSSLDGSSTDVQIALRECRQIDGRMLYVNTAAKFYHSSSSAAKTISIILAVTFIGFLVTLCCGGLDVGFFTLVGFILGVVLAVRAASMDRIITIRADTPISFDLEEPATSEVTF